MINLKNNSDVNDEDMCLQGDLFVGSLVSNSDRKSDSDPDGELLEEEELLKIDSEPLEDGIISDSNNTEQNTPLPVS